MAIQQITIISSFRNVEEYVVGSRKKLLMSVAVKNNGEDSYETQFNMRMPYDVQYVRLNKSAAHVSMVWAVCVCPWSY